MIKPEDDWSRPTDWELTAELAQEFPAKYVQKAPQGKHGTYINHADITQRLLAVHGPYSFEVKEVIRGFAPEIVGQNKTFPAREGAVLGVTASLTIIDKWGVRYTITEVGTEDQPAMSHDAENLKSATSDAFKRCAMRLGLGLQLWAKEGYHLPGQLKQRQLGDSEVTREPFSEDAETGETPETVPAGDETAA
jgi:hypothetical protein